MKAFFGKK